ncbi:MAG: DUF411 domain-containing protein [Pseudomonadota bacterium]
MKYRVGFLVLSLLLVSFGSGIARGDDTAAEPLSITVYKSPTCGCCKQWIAHLQENGFNVLAVDSDDMSAVKAQFEVPEELRSCHTARINGYTVEGHVPAEDILAMLENAPEAKGLSVPGMPVGSPGMEVGDRVDPYEVIQFSSEGNEVVASYGEPSAVDVDGEQGAQ